VVSGQTYTAFGGQIALGTGREGDDARASGLSLQLSGVNQTILAALLTDFYRGRLATISRVYYDAAGAVIGGAVVLYEGYLNDDWQLRALRSEQLDAGNAILETRIGSRLNQPNQQRGIRTNLTSHQRQFSGDLFFQFVPAIAGKTIKWGAPVIVGGGAPDDSGDPHGDE
jgi:hypothetical protein